MKKPTFKQLLKKRDAKYKRLKVLDEMITELTQEIVDIEHSCVGAMKWGDKFERRIDIGNPFSTEN